MLGISVPHRIGIGDAIQFTMVPENYFRTFGKKLIDVEKHWVFDHNPFVLRGGEKPAKVAGLWNFNPIPKPRGSVFTSLAEKHTLCVGAKVFLRHPRLYKFEDFPFRDRHMILFQAKGISHGPLPKKIVEHVIKKYRGPDLYQIGHANEVLHDIGIPWVCTPTVWDLVEVISRARMYIGPDSGPSWIAACYPDIVIKKVRMKPTIDQLKNWVPLEITNTHAQWDDLQLHSVYNPTEDDIGFTSSYLRL